MYLSKTRNVHEGRKNTEQMLQSCTHEVLFSFQHIDADVEAVEPRLIWIDIESVVCAIKEGRFYIVAEKSGTSGTTLL
jgi:hypothetical protein